jgi:DNA-directed RNA polymerase subunit beta'
VIVGRLIPAGTGGMLRQIRRVAGKRDELIAKEHARSDAKSLAEGSDQPKERRRRRPSEEAAE